MSDAATLAGLRLADSFLPIGTDSLSYGIEQFVADDAITDTNDLRALLESYLREQFGPSDLVALRAAHAGASENDPEAIAAADRQLSAVALAAEFRESSTLAGERLLALQSDLHGDGLLEEYATLVESGKVPGNYTVVLGIVTEREGVPVHDACLLACHGFVTGLLGAAQRLLRLGHTDIQRVLDDLRPVMSEAVEDSADSTLERMSPFAPLVEIRSAEHERADRRLFKS